MMEGCSAHSICQIPASQSHTSEELTRTGKLQPMTPKNWQVSHCERKRTPSPKMTLKMERGRTSKIPAPGRMLGKRRIVDISTKITLQRYLVVHRTDSNHWQDMTYSTYCRTVTRWSFKAVTRTFLPHMPAREGKWSLDHLGPPYFLRRRENLIGRAKGKLDDKIPPNMFLKSNCNQILLSSAQWTIRPHYSNEKPPTRPTASSSSVTSDSIASGS